MDANGILSFCKNVCHPNTPNPIALPFLADLCALTSDSLPEVFAKNSSNTPSKKYIAVSTRSVFFHSCHLVRLTDDRQQMNECSSSVCKVISEQILVILTSRLFFLYAGGLALLTLSPNIIYGSPVSTLDFNILTHNSIASASLCSSFCIKLSSTTTHWCRFRHCLLGSPLGLRISRNSCMSG